MASVLLWARTSLTPHVSNKLTEMRRAIGIDQEQPSTESLSMPRERGVVGAVGVMEWRSEKAWSCSNCLPTAVANDSLTNREWQLRSGARERISRPRSNVRGYGMHNDWNSSDPKRLVSGPCWDLYLRYQLFESLSPCCCHDVPCEQQLDTQCVLVC